MTMRTTPCRECGAEIEVEGEPIVIAGMEFDPLPTLCDGCFDSVSAAKSKADREHLARQRWTEAVPPRYRTASWDQCPDPRIARVARAWRSASGIGFGLLGPARCGKTSACFLALKRAAWEGRTVAACTHPQFVRLVQDATSGATDQRNHATGILADLRSAGVLVLDDLGKGAFSQRAVGELWELLEFRSSRSRPTLWTANVGSESLADRFRNANTNDDFAGPILGRLREFSPAVSLFQK